MKINIGDNLKQLRLQRGLTQEQVAETFGVSAQAISRWENNTSYPDITLLPGLAIYYNTSVDAIVGMDEIRKEEALRKIHTEINELVRDNQIDEAVLLIRDSLKIYPNNSGLLMSLGETLAHQSDNSVATREAITIAEQILQSDDVGMKAKGTTSANLLFLYLKDGRDEKAKELIRSLPHIWESREILMPEVYDGEEYTEELRKCIIKVLVFLCQKIEAEPSRCPGEIPDYIQLGVNFEPKKSVEEMVRVIREFLGS